MIILDPEKEIASLIWEDIKEFPWEWCKLIYMIATDLAYEIFLVIYNQINRMIVNAPWWQVILLAGLTGHIIGLFLW